MMVQYQPFPLGAEGIYEEQFMSFMGVHIVNA